MAHKLRDGSKVSDKRLARLVHFDKRSKKFPIRKLVAGQKPRTYTWECDTVLDQGTEGACVGASCTHELIAKPKPIKGLNMKFAREQVYWEAQKIDDWAGGSYPGAKPTYDGTSVLCGVKVLQKLGYIQEYRWSFSLDDLILAVGHVGPAILGINWYECVVPGTRILTRNLIWVPVEKLVPGDELVAFDEQPPFAKYQIGTVLTNEVIVRPVVRIVTDRGNIVASTNHRFIRCHRSYGRSWALASDLQPGDQLAYMTDPWEIDRSWEAGYLAGFYDGEGSVAQDCRLVSAAQKPGPTMDRVLGILDAKRVEYRSHLNLKTGVYHWNISGSYAAALSFLGRIRPERLLAKAECLWLDRQTWNKSATPVTVQSVEPLGDDKVHAIGTSTGTLITEGFLSHNSMVEPHSCGCLHIGGKLSGGHAILCRGVNVKEKTFLLHNSWGKDWGNNGTAKVTFEEMDKLIHESGEACIPLVRTRG